MQPGTDFLQQHGIKLSAIGLFGLAAYFASIGKYPEAMASLTAGLGAYGIHINFPTQFSPPMMRRRMMATHFPGQPIEPEPAPEPMSKTAAALAALIVALAAGASGNAVYQKNVTPKAAEALVLPDTVKAPMVRVTDIKAVLPPGTPYKWVVPAQPGMEFRNDGLNGSFFAELPGTYYVSIAYGAVGQDMASSSCTVTVPEAMGPDIEKPRVSPSSGPIPAPPKQLKADSKPVAAQAIRLQVIIVDVAGEAGKSWTTKGFAISPALTDKILGKHEVRFIDVSGKDSKGNFVQELAQVAEMVKGSGKAPWVLLVNNATGISIWDGQLTTPEVLLAKITETERGAP